MNEMYAVMLAAADAKKKYGEGGTGLPAHLAEAALSATILDLGNTNYAKVRTSEAVRSDVFRRGFAPPLPQDYPTVTVARPGDSPLGTSGGTRLREKRVGDVSTNPVDLAGDTRFRYDGTPALDGVGANPTQFVVAPYLPGGTSQAARYTYSVDTITEPLNNAVEFYMRPPGTEMQYRVYVDGKPVKIEAYHNTGLLAGYDYNIRLAFPTARARTIRITFMGDLGFGGVYVPTGQALTRPTAPIQKRVAIVGDSFEGGSGSTPTGGSRLETGGSLAAHLLGADSIWNFGIGGTGYIATVNTFQTRAQAVLDSDPDVVIISGTRNDGTADTQTLRDAVTLLLTTLAAVPEIYVTGPSTVPYAPNNEAVKAMTVAAGRDFIDALEGPWLEAGMIGADNIHPTWVGHQRRASKLHEGIAALTAP
jgi:lysophospholipase L1-like esterase